MTSSAPNGFTGAAIESAGAQSSPHFEKCGLDKPQAGCATRVHPEGKLSPDVYLLKKGALLFMVHLGLMERLKNDPAVSKYRLYLCQSEDGRVFYWPVRDSAPSNTWQESSHQCARRATERPRRIYPNNANNRYETLECGDWPNGVNWPAKDRDVLLSEAFNEFIIKDFDNPLLKALGYKQ